MDARFKRYPWQEQTFEGTARTSFQQDAAHCRQTQVDPLAPPRQFGEMAVVGDGYAGAGQLDHSSALCRGQGFVDPQSPVGVDKRLGAVLRWQAANRH